MQDGKIDELKDFLSKNKECLDKGAVDGYNYFTYALESGNVAALKVLLQIPRDTKMFARVFQEDARQKSVFGAIKSNSATYGSLATALYLWGMRGEKAWNGENLADIFWNLRDGVRTLELANAGVFALGKGANIEGYLAQAASEVFTDLIRAYVTSTGMPLKKSFIFRGGKHTLLDIAALNAGSSTFNLSLHRFYLEQGGFVSEGDLDLSVLATFFLVRKLSQDKKLHQEVDRFIFEIPKRHPVEWARYVDQSHNQHSVLSDVFASLLRSQHIALETAVKELIPIAQPARIWNIDGVSAESREFRLYIKLLVDQGRYPIETTLPFLESTKIYADGLQLGLYPKPATCKLFTKPATVSEVTPADLERLASFGLKPENCKGAVDVLMERLDVKHPAMLAMAKFTGEFPFKLADKILYYQEPDGFWKLIADYGVTDLAVKAVSDERLAKDFWIRLFTKREMRLNQIIDLLESNNLAFDTARAVARNNIDAICQTANLSKLGLKDLRATLAKLGTDLTRTCLTSALAATSAPTGNYWEALDGFFGDDPQAKSLIRQFELTPQLCRAVASPSTTTIIAKYGLEPLTCWQGLLESLGKIEAPSGLAYDTWVTHKNLAAAFPEIATSVLSNALSKNCYTWKGSKRPASLVVQAIMAILDPTVGPTCADQWIFQSQGGIGGFKSPFYQPRVDWILPKKDFERYFLEPWAEIQVNGFAKEGATLFSDLQIVSIERQMAAYWQRLKPEEVPVFIQRALDILDFEMCIGRGDYPDARDSKRYDTARRTCLDWPRGGDFLTEFGMTPNRFLTLPFPAGEYSGSAYKTWGLPVLQEFLKRTYSGKYAAGHRELVEAYLASILGRQLSGDISTCRISAKKDAPVCVELATTKKADWLPVICHNRNKLMWVSASWQDPSPVDRLAAITGEKITEDDCKAAQ
jgi:hypothetical protein